MSERPVLVSIGGTVFTCPPMPFYCLELAWPHIRTLGRMGSASQSLMAAQIQVSHAITTQEHQTASENLEIAMKIVEDLGADIIGQTHTALNIIAAALALDPNPPSQVDLAKVLRPDEISGVHIAVAELLDVSGLVTRGGTTTVGESVATMAGLTPSLNGAATSLN
jgi:DNA-binding XRE family transcriptional regulator